MLTDICHSPPAWCQSSCSHQCCCWQTFLWHSWRWIPAEFEFGSGSRQSRHGRAWECPCRNKPGPCSRSQWTGSSKGSMARLESRNKDAHCKKKKKKMWKKSISSNTEETKVTFIYFKELWDIVNHSDFIGFMTHRKSNLYPAWQDSSCLLWLQSLQFSLSDLFCFSPDIFHVRLWENVINANTALIPFGCTFAQRKFRPDLQYFRADHSNAVACRQSEIGFHAPSLLKLRRQSGHFKPSPHELWGQKKKIAQTVKWAFKEPPVEGMNKSAYFSGFNKMCSRCPA